MKLVSMVDYVKRKHISVIKEVITEKQFVNQVTNYANFLNRPLEISMFVPCDEEGNVLEQPSNNWSYPMGSLNSDNKQRGKDLRKYNEAKERVLFKGFKYFDNEGAYYTTNYDSCFLYHYELNNEEITIEDLITNNLTLTESAIKQLK